MKFTRTHPGLRSALREFYPGVLGALGTQLAEPEALAILELAPTPGQGRRLTRAAVRRALVGAGRRRNLQARVVAVHDALATPQLAAPKLVEAAYRQVVGALVASLRCLNQQIIGLEQQLAGQFGTHPDAAIIRSQLGLGVVLGGRLLGSSAMTRTAMPPPRAAGPSLAPLRSPDPRGFAPVVVARAACNRRLVDDRQRQAALCRLGRQLERKVFIDFCRRLLHDAPGPVFLVLDGHPVHRSKAVKAFAASTGGRLRLCFLPGYAPELIPDAWVWKHGKHDRIGRAGVTGPEDLKAKALAALHRLQRLPHLVQSFFQDPNLRYITA